MVCYALSKTRLFVGPSLRTNDDHTAESGHLVFRGTSASSRGPLKSREAGRHQHISTRNQRLQRYCYASLFPSIIFVYGAKADWCQDLAQQIEAHSPSSTGNSFQIRMMIQRLKSHQRTYPISPNHQCSILWSEETRCGNTNRNSITFQNILNYHSTENDYRHRSFVTEIFF